MDSRINPLSRAKIKKIAKLRPLTYCDAATPYPVRHLFKKFNIIRTQLMAAHQLAAAPVSWVLARAQIGDPVLQFPFHIDNFPFLPTRHGRRRSLAFLKNLQARMKSHRRLVGGRTTMAEKAADLNRLRQKLVASAAAGAANLIQKYSQRALADKGKQRFHLFGLRRTHCSIRRVRVNKDLKQGYFHPIGRRASSDALRRLRNTTRRGKDLADARWYHLFFLRRKGRGGRRAFRRKIRSGIWHLRKDRRTRWSSRRRKLRAEREARNPSVRVLRMKYFRRTLAIKKQKLVRWSSLGKVATKRTHLLKRLRLALNSKTIRQAAFSRKRGKRGVRYGYRISKRVRQSMLVTRVKVKNARVTRRQSTQDGRPSTAQTLKKLLVPSFKTFLNKLPYFLPQYRRYARLRAKITRPAVTKRGQLRHKASNNARLLKSADVLNSRATPAEQWGASNTPFVLPTTLQAEERFKRELYKKRDRIRQGDLKTENKAGYPAAIGYRRLRRVFISKFNSNR